LKGPLSRTDQDPETSEPLGGEPSDTIVAYDAYGREYQVTREKWRTEVLPGVIADASSSASALSEVLMMALRDGFHAEVAAAAPQLMRLDGGSEQSVVIYASALWKLGQVEDARGLLRDHARWHGESAYVLGEKDA
jgi:hypothetical protein